MKINPSNRIADAVEHLYSSIPARTIKVNAS